MANTIGKKYVTDENGEKFYPIGHIGAIYDDNGNTLDSVLSGKASDTHTHTKSEITDFPTIPSMTLNGSSTTSPSWYAPTSGVNSTYGGVLYSYSGGTPQWTIAGTSGYVLQSNGSGSAPSWKAVTDSSSASAISTGTSLVTERDVYYGLPSINGAHTYNSSSTYYAPTTGKNSYGGGVLYSNSSGAPSWTSYGTSGYFLKANGTNTAPSWTNTLPATTYINTTSYRVVGTTTGYNTKIHVAATEPSSMSVGDIWIKIPS